MPTIFDNIRVPLADGLRNVLPDAAAASFCVGYLNLRGWGQLADLVERLPGGEETRACRLLAGMHRPRGWGEVFRSAAFTGRLCVFALNRFPMISRAKKSRTLQRNEFRAPSPVGASIAASRRSGRTRRRT